MRGLSVSGAAGSKGVVSSGGEVGVSGAGSVGDGGASGVSSSPPPKKLHDSVTRATTIIVTNKVLRFIFVSPLFVSFDSIGNQSCYRSPVSIRAITMRWTSLVPS
jgi:hypothetical protein